MCSPIVAQAVATVLVCVSTLATSVSCATIPAVNVDAARVVSQLLELGKFSDVPAPAVTRILYTERDVEARAFLRQTIADVGLTVREDAIGNIFARLPAADGSHDGAVGTGSHFDAIPVSGMYDGTLGVLGGLEAIRALRDAGFKPERPLELLAFTSEEPTRFQLGCLGSRALVGAKSWEDLLSLNDSNNISFDNARREAGMEELADGETLELPDGYYSAFLELHIEQGRRLEDDGLDIGTVWTMPGVQKIPWRSTNAKVYVLWIPRANLSLFLDLI
jgi:ureidoglycolate amidohydrolase